MYHYAIPATLVPVTLETTNPFAFSSSPQYASGTNVVARQRFEQAYCPDMSAVRHWTWLRPRPWYQTYKQERIVKAGSFSEEVQACVQTRSEQIFQSKSNEEFKADRYNRSLYRDYRVELSLNKIRVKLEETARRAQMMGDGERFKEKRVISNQALPVAAKEEKGVGIAETQGKRPQMEDTHVVDEFDFSILNEKHHIKILAVFDGHSGGVAAKFASENLVGYLKHYLEQCKFSNLGEQGNIYNALTLALVNLGESCKESTLTLNSGILHAHESGTAAVVACLVDGHKLFVANAGDSRALIIHDEGVIHATEDAAPDIIHHREGVEKRGGNITYKTEGSKGRVSGDLAMTSALGDARLPSITPRPEMTYCNFKTLQNPRVLLASDGLFEAASSKQIAASVDFLKGKSAKEIAEWLVRDAVESGSKDNCTCLVL